MYRKNAGNNKFLKELNQAHIMNLIRVNKAISKIELSQMTGLSPTAIGSITNELQTQGYIHETIAGASTGGRPPRLLELKAGSYYSIGVDFDVDCLNIVLIDITGDIIYQNSSKVTDGNSPEKIFEMIDYLSYSAIGKCISTKQKLLGIGVSIPGLIDRKNVEVIMVPNLGWRNINIKSYMQKYKDVPLYLENESMASAICENWIGNCRGVENFICINIKSGIGSGIFINGGPYYGEGGTAGEIGHITVDEDGPKCGCGNFGCLETMASAGYIVKKAKKMVRQGMSSKLINVEDIDNVSIDDIVKAARGGDEALIGILKDSGRYLGIAIATIVNMLNPQKIVIGKEFIKYADIVLDTIKSVIVSKALKSPTSNLEIVASEIGERSSTIGAALLPVKELFSVKNIY